MSGIKGKSGRKKSLSTLIAETLDDLDADIPALFEALKDKAVIVREIECPGCSHRFKVFGGGDKEALIYLIDRRLGKPKVQIEADVKDIDQIGVGMFMQLQKFLLERNALQGLGETKQLSEATNETQEG